MEPDKPSRTPSRLLQVSNEYFTAGAIFEHRGYWRCREAAPIIRWMIGMPVDRIKFELIKRGCRWEWL
jgi:hypothetical protein